MYNIPPLEEIVEDEKLLKPQQQSQSAQSNETASMSSCAVDVSAATSGFVNVEIGEVNAEMVVDDQVVLESNENSSHMDTAIELTAKSSTAKSKVDEMLEAYMTKYSHPRITTATPGPVLTTSPAPLKIKFKDKQIQNNGKQRLILHFIKQINLGCFFFNFNHKPCI